MGVLAVKKLEPVLFVRSLGTAGPECFELLAFAKLIGDLAPKEVVRVVATVEGGDVGRLESLGVGRCPRNTACAARDASRAGRSRRASGSCRRPWPA